MAALSQWKPGIWRFRLPGLPAEGSASRDQADVLAGVTDRSCGLDALRSQLPCARAAVQAEQVHGASLASVVDCDVPALTVPGCDGLATHALGLALIIRTADCLPVFAWDPVRRVVAVIHAGWRGLAASLPMRLIAFLREVYGSRPEELWVGIGPAIHACCYEVGPEFSPRFGPFLRQSDGRLMCDLIGCAVDQLRRMGVRASAIHDSGVCTACETQRWYSYRREGEQGGRLLSFMVMCP